MSDSIRVVSTNLSEAKGEAKHPVPEVVITRDGIAGDAHAGPWHRQVSLLSVESIEAFARRADMDISPGDFAENLTVSGIDLTQVQLLDRFRVGEALFEVTQIGKACHGDGCAIFQRVGKCVMPTEGIFCRVLSGGVVRAGDEVEYHPKVLRLHVVTLSDRAYRGEYEDRSGPKLCELLEEHCGEGRWPVEVSTALLPDDPQKLREELRSAQEEGADAIFTTGGTGVGPRDRAPEVVTAFCDRLIPGIMEVIRVKYGAQNPRALLSRSVAGVAGTALVYALPGSVRAVEEYVGEIALTLEHLVLTIHDVDVHAASHAPECSKPPGSPQ